MLTLVGTCLVRPRSCRWQQGNSTLREDKGDMDNVFSRGNGVREEQTDY
jgi:hypothetical protein